MFISDEDCALPPDDFLQALSSELEIPLLLGGEGSPGNDETPDEIIKGAVLLPPPCTFEELGVNLVQYNNCSVHSISSLGKDLTKFGML
ncbi:uncharacterized protein LOC112494572 isoform X2 [Cephus cinctus]|uniref:Uncharacterized protein LOC112494572 isoform X2 n=1 Tax=Cephus cinctus TaxID=211228 RepID=A0AAJ7W2U2_CEPCN|nr:uncharacterized protein LOC112494572 isoform X2 [Cephus cinctus]